MTKIAITGLSGVIGSRLIENIGNLEIVNLYNKNKILNENIIKNIHLNLLNEDNVKKALSKSEPDVIVHLASKTHIDFCEKDKKNGKKGIVWKTNVNGTKYIAKFAAKNKIKLIFLSTECVFDGEEDYFEEKSNKKPINWYGTTKHFAEEEIFQSGASAAIVRSVVAYHLNDEGKTIYGKILNSLKSKKNIDVVSDQMFTPTYTEDIVEAVNKLILNKKRGIFHVAPSKSTTPYDFALLIADRNKISKKYLNKVKLVDVYGKESAGLRLRNASLKGQKTNKLLDLKPKSPKKVLSK